MIVYVDVAFAINLLIDAGLLVVTASLLRRRVRMRRVVAAAAVGSLYAVATLFPGTGWLRGAFVKWLCSVWMVDAAFETHAVFSRSLRRLPQLMRIVAAFYAVTFATAGAVYALLGLFSKDSQVLSGFALVGGRVAWWTSIRAVTLVLAVPAGLLAVRGLFSLFGRLRRLASMIFPVRIAIGDRMVTVRGFADTGNALVDPIGRTPVAVVWAESVLHLLPDTLRQAVSEGRDPLGALADAEDGLRDFGPRVRVVPYRTVGGGSGQLLAFRPDEATALLQDREVSLPPMLVGLQLQPLSKAGEFDCILPAGAAASVVEGREKGVDTDSRATSGEAARNSHSA